ncbi:MAG: hypothetical protein AB8H80_04265 [Planctomycetota bacterium]
MFGPSTSFPRDDFYETHVQGGFQLQMPDLGLTIRGERLLILNDRETVQGQGQRRSTGGSMGGSGGRSKNGLPQRGIPQPDPRRRLSPDELRRRVARTMRALGKSQTRTTGAAQPLSDEVLRMFRYLYCEGGIIVVQNGAEVVRCDELHISPVDNRIVVHNAELRYTTSKGTQQQTLVVRGPKLVKQGARWIGEDLVLTTCTAAKPHAALAVQEAEIIERDGEFEVVTRGATLQLGQISVLPLPDARFFTGSQSQFPIKRASAGYSGQLGAQLGIVFGLPWNETGGQLHHWLTGRPAQEFRGEWELGTGWIQERGFPLEGSLTYSADGLYFGRTDAFFLSDQGENIREITRNIDGSLIGDDSRGVLRTKNRVFLGRRGSGRTNADPSGMGQNTHVDLVAFHQSDAAVYPEFFVGPYRTEEVPETSAYLHHADGNHLLTIGTRFNLSDFSYRDDRALATRFVEELPVMTYQWLAEPIAETPWETPIVLDLETQIGQRRSDYDDRAGVRVSDRTLRADQHVELSMPFPIGALNVRPYVSGRGTFYDETLLGDGSEARIALEGGVQIGTRLSRTFRLSDQSPTRHVIAPRLTYRNRYHVDDDPNQFFQFDDVDPLRLQQLGYDSIDTLSERELVRFEVRNLFQRMSGEGADRGPRDFLFLDLAQDVFPNSTRDNGGDTLGLFFYDLLLRPKLDWLPFDDFALSVYGDLDWDRGMRTLDTELQFGKVFGIDWTIEYREDSLVDGALALAGQTQLYDRWNLFAGAQRDLEQDEWLSYTFGLQRNDHDWSIALTATFNPFVDETQFRIEFLPRFGFQRQRTGRFAGNNVRDRYSFDY